MEFKWDQSLWNGAANILSLFSTDNSTKEDLNLKSQIEDMRSAIKQKDQLISELMEKLEQQKANVLDLEERLKKQEELNLELQQRNQALQEKSEYETERHKYYKRCNRKSEDKNTVLKQKIEEFTLANKKQYERSREESQDYQRNMSRLEMENAKLFTANQSLFNNIQKKMQEIKKLKEENIKQKNTIEELQKKIEELTKTQQKKGTEAQSIESLQKAIDLQNQKLIATELQKQPTDEQQKEDDNDKSQDLYPMTDKISKVLQTTQKEVDEFLSDTLQKTGESKSTLEQPNKAQQYKKLPLIPDPISEEFFDELIKNANPIQDAFFDIYGQENHNDVFQNTSDNDNTKQNPLNKNDVDIENIPAILESAKEGSPEFNENLNKIKDIDTFNKIKEKITQKGIKSHEHLFSEGFYFFLTSDFNNNMSIDGKFKYNLSTIYSDFKDQIKEIERRKKEKENRTNSVLTMAENILSLKNDKDRLKYINENLKNIKNYIMFNELGECLKNVKDIENSELISFLFSEKIRAALEEVSNSREYGEGLFCGILASFIEEFNVKFSEHSSDITCGPSSIPQ